MSYNKIYKKCEEFTDKDIQAFLKFLRSKEKNGILLFQSFSCLVDGLGGGDKKDTLLTMLDIVASGSVKHGHGVFVYNSDIIDFANSHIDVLNDFFDIYIDNDLISSYFNSFHLKNIARGILNNDSSSCLVDIVMFIVDEMVETLIEIFFIFMEDKI